MQKYLIHSAFFFNFSDLESEVQKTPESPEILKGNFRKLYQK